MFSELPGHPPSVTGHVTAGKYLLAHQPANSQHRPAPRTGTAHSGAQLMLRCKMEGRGSLGAHRELGGSSAWSGTTAITFCLYGHSGFLWAALQGWGGHLNCARDAQHSAAWQAPSALSGGGSSRSSVGEGRREGPPQAEGNSATPFLMALPIGHFL